MWLDTRANLGSWPHGSLNHFYGVFSPDFLWPVVLLCLVLSPYLVYLRVLPCVCVHISQPRWVLAKRPMGRLSITSFLTSKELSSLEGFLGSENYTVSYLLSALSCLAVYGLEFLSTGSAFLGGPIYLLSGAVFILYQELTKKTHYFLSIQ